MRVTATELRKKLAQYYYADGHDDAIRIELPPGSYLPKFHRSTDVPPIAEPSAIVSPASFPENSDRPLAALPVTENSPRAAATQHAATSAGTWRLSAVVLAGLLVAALLGYLPLLAKLRPTPIARFWTSFAGPNSQVRIVMPVIGTDWVSSAKRPSDVSVSPNLSLEDTNIAARVAGQLEKSGLRYLISPAPEVNFAELRTGPAVLIGALDNVWTLQLSKDLPFVFQESAGGRVGSILESKPEGRAKPRIWSVDITTPINESGRTTAS